MWRLTDEQRALREEIRRVVLEEIRPRLSALGEGDDYPYDIHEVLAKRRLLGLAIPEEYGGRGQTTVAFNACIEELAKVSGTVSLMAAYVKLAALPIVIAGSDEQKRRFLPGLASGELFGSYAITEPDAGSDPAALQTVAERRGNALVVNGCKRFIGNAGMADFISLFVRTGDPGAKGVSVLVVPGDADGISVEPLDTMGLPGWKLGEISFDDVEVPAENLIGEEGSGFKTAMIAFDHSRPTVAAQAVGLAQGAIDLAVDYSLRRRTFGKPLAMHEGVQFRLATMEADVAAARALAYQAATFVDEGQQRMSKISSAAKMVASDTAMRVTTEALELLGGNGYLRGFPAERMMRDAKVLQIYEGANDIQKLVIARRMGEEAAGRDPVWPDCMPGEGDVASGEAAPSGEKREQAGAVG